MQRRGQLLSLQRQRMLQAGVNGVTLTYIALACRFLIAFVFAVSAFTKLRSGRDFRAFASWLTDLHLPLAGRPAATVLAGTEAAVVLLVALPWSAVAGLSLAAATMAVFAAGTFVVVRRGSNVPCRCFGSATAPLSSRHVIRNLALCATAVIGAVGAGGTGARPPGIALSLAVALVAATFVVFLDDLTAVFSGPLPVSRWDR
jgi:Methylamine utilisation protein MauE